MVLIVILLGLAGFFLFAQPIKAPVVTDEVVPVVQQESVTVLEDEEVDAVGEDAELGDMSTTTASTTLDLETGLEE
jgi:hypothetical protein